MQILVKYYNYFYGHLKKALISPCGENIICKSFGPPLQEHILHQMQ